MLPEIVWLLDERTYGVLVNRGSEFSKVRYTHGGIDYNILVENTDYEFIEERAIDYESD